MAEIRFTVMKRSKILYLVFISGFSSFILGSSDFHLIELSKTYEESRSYCRKMYTDLATINSSVEMDHLISLVLNTAARAWIGLEIGDVWIWRWSWPDHHAIFFNWKAGEPQKKNQDACAAMDQHGKWFESDCGIKRSFVCHGNSESGHIFVANTKSWRNAQTHCRGLSSELVSISSAKENEAVRNVSISQNVWIGLFKDPWKWSDGSNSSFRYWNPTQPNYLEGQHCVAAVFKNKGQWNDLRCSGKRKFVCRGARKLIPTTTVETSTQETSSTHHPPTSITTSSYTPFNNVTSVTLTTQPTSLTSPENSHILPPGNLTLIQQNMTWIEAMSYCRKHHIDLVHISNKEIQEMVAEIAKNATSAHVWLGLRYTCTFDFWFWTTSMFGCYQNWAPGEGAESKYACGVTGAIDTTRGQQWVGLPETEKLNFICYSCAD